MVAGPDVPELAEMADERVGSTRLFTERGVRGSFRGRLDLPGTNLLQTALALPIIAFSYSPRLVSLTRLSIP